ncbi:MAG: YegS/Rv2252/BmrU family lipid kinase [Flavobacterium sp.]|nr:MAG: YegS/Rv2252/BmrU family lipid kinase [Flavobacterium sp.]
MGSHKKMLMVVNPISGGSDKADMLEAATIFADKDSIELVVVETTGEDDEKTIRELYDLHKPERILVAGGDGTIKMVAETLQDVDVIIGVIPAGSANGLSVDLDLPSDMDSILDVAFHGAPMEMDMVCINGKKSLHLSDIGVNAELIRNYEGSNIRGKLGYALHAINTLTDLEEPFHASIVANGRTIETEARMVVIANTQKYGTGVTINPVGIMNDGLFEIVILKNMDILVIGKILSGNIPVDSNEDVEIISTAEATIKTNFPVCFQIDGEFCGEVDSLDIKILPRQMKVAVP